MDPLGPNPGRESWGIWTPPVQILVESIFPATPEFSPLLVLVLLHIVTATRGEQGQ